MPSSKKLREPYSSKGEHSFKTVNVSWDTFDHIMAERQPGDSLNTVIRRIMKLEVPDPTRPKSKRQYYYDEDWK